MSDTPRTDNAAMAWKNHQDGRGCSMWRTPHGGVVFADFARQLERELDAMEKQRDEARREVCLSSCRLWIPEHHLTVAAERGWDCFDAKEAKP